MNKYNFNRKTSVKNKKKQWLFFIFTFYMYHLRNIQLFSNIIRNKSVSAAIKFKILRNFCLFLNIFRKNLEVMFWYLPTSFFIRFGGPIFWETFQNTISLIRYKILLLFKMVSKLYLYENRHAHKTAVYHNISRQTLSSIVLFCCVAKRRQN